VEKENPDVIMLGNNQYEFTNLDKVKIPKALKCADPWANIARHIQFIKHNNIQMVLMNYNCATPEYKKHLPDRIFRPLPHAANRQLFPLLGLKRTLDVVSVDGCPETYPLRHLTYHYLKTSNYKTFLFSAHTISFEEYVRKINEAKIFAYGNVNRRVGESPILIHPVAKMFEIMSCGALCMMDTPTEANELNLVPEYNFAAITRDNFKERISYYLWHDDEREKIADRGHETLIKYHTIEIRGRQLKEYLEEITRK
jgi:hypothetical protein